MLLIHPVYLKVERLPLRLAAVYAPDALDAVVLPSVDFCQLVVEFELLGFLAGLEAAAVGVEGGVDVLKLLHLVLHAHPRPGDLPHVENRVGDLLLFLGDALRKEIAL